MVLHLPPLRKGYGVTLIGDEVLSEQQKVADAFLQLGLITKPFNVRDAAPESFAAGGTSC
jgi:hypothetical protein